MFKTGSRTQIKNVFRSNVIIYNVNVIIGSQCLSGVVSVTSDHVFAAMGSALLDIRGFRISMDIYRHPWTSIEILAIREVSMDTHGCSWISMDIYRYPLYPWVSVYPKKVSMTMYLHRFPTEGGGEPLYNPSSRTMGGSQGTCCAYPAHIPRISPPTKQSPGTGLYATPTD